MACPTPTAVRIRGLHATYAATAALHDIDVDVPVHQTTAVVGPNGSGKSTLLATIAGVHLPTRGTVERAHLERPALVVQRSAVSDTLPITVRETVTMGRWAHLGSFRRPTRADRAIVDACLERVEITDLAPRPLGSLSSGQRQRVLLAQGLAQCSDLLLLDEPTAGLDRDVHAAITHLLDEVCASGVTVVHATHDSDVAARADQLLRLDGGRLDGSDVPPESPTTAGTNP